MTKATAAWTAPNGREIDPVLVQALIDTIGNTFFAVHFYAKDGEIRKINRARLNVVSRMANNDASAAARETLAAHNLIPVVDLSKEEDLESRDKGWRSFKAGRVAYIKGAGVTYTAQGYDPTA